MRGHREGDLGEDRGEVIAVAHDEVAHLEGTLSWPRLRRPARELHMSCGVMLGAGGHKRRCMHVHGVDMWEGGSKGERMHEA